MTGGDSEPLYIFALTGFGLWQYMHFEMERRAEREVWAEA